ncbi:uncharacterized protein N7477_005785 [Penicillium maclennaniae]|uniref:uncharacterized protein n=1 Tax=Penicillium maclennaniae TaxID=1343394 RepID=UPI00254001C5|nr:uncharacterized protein N7477_005785 [Penicillium maclennaniae]KAJ5670422.1 hypothetical protein N7477_005785 [Penicillium maclennaniae]
MVKSFPHGDLNRAELIEDVLIEDVLIEDVLIEDVGKFIRSAQIFCKFVVGGMNYNPEKRRRRMVNFPAAVRTLPGPRQQKSRASFVVKTHPMFEIKIKNFSL